MGARRNILHTAYLPTDLPHAGDGRKRNLPGVCQNFFYQQGSQLQLLHIGTLVLFFFFGFFGSFSGSVNSASVVFGVKLTPCLSKRYADRGEEARSSSASLL